MYVTYVGLIEEGHRPTHILRLWNRLDECVVTKSSIDLRWMFCSCPSSRFGSDGYSSGEVGFMIVLLAAILAFVAGGTSLIKTSRATNSLPIYHIWCFKAVLSTA